MKGKLLASLSVFAALSFSSFAVWAEDEAPVLDASSTYHAAEEQKADAAVPVSDQSQDSTAEKVTSDSNSKPQPSSGSVASQPNQPAKTATSSNLNSLPTEQRVQRLEQQVNNIANMNLPQQITLLQQQVAQLRGQLEVQGHDLQLINTQLRSFYKDLDNRINQMNNLNTSGGAAAQTTSKNSMLHTSTSVELQDANAYQVAFSQLVNHQLDKSKQSFGDYLNQYPNGKYVADSHYWLGEIYLSNKDYKNANAEFATVLSKYPQSSKVSDAKLKIAIIHANTGNVDRAKSELKSIKKSHPESTAAQLANIRLQQLDEGQDFTGN